MALEFSPTGEEVPMGRCVSARSNIAVLVLFSSVWTGCWTVEIDHEENIPTVVGQNETVYVTAVCEHWNIHSPEDLSWNLSPEPGPGYGIIVSSPTDFGYTPQFNSTYELEYNEASQTFSFRFLTTNTIFDETYYLILTCGSGFQKATQTFAFTLTGCNSASDCDDGNSCSVESCDNPIAASMYEGAGCQHGWLDQCQDDGLISEIAVVPPPKRALFVSHQGSSSADESATINLFSFSADDFAASADELDDEKWALVRSSCWDSNLPCSLDANDTEYLEEELQGVFHDHVTNTWSYSFCPSLVYDPTQEPPVLPMSLSEFTPKRKVLLATGPDDLLGNHYFKAHLAGILGSPLSHLTAEDAPGYKGGDEGYIIYVDPIDETIVLWGIAPHGTFNAIQTLWWLLRETGGYLPGGLIIDWPDFSVRAQYYNPNSEDEKTCLHYNTYNGDDGYDNYFHNCNPQQYPPDSTTPSCAAIFNNGSLWKHFNVLTRLKINTVVTYLDPAKSIHATNEGDNPFSEESSLHDGYDYMKKHYMTLHGILEPRLVTGRTSAFLSCGSATHLVDAWRTGPIPIHLEPTGGNGGTFAAKYDTGPATAFMEDTAPESVCGVREFVDTIDFSDHYLTDQGQLAYFVKADDPIPAEAIGELSLVAGVFHLESMTDPPEGPWNRQWFLFGSRLVLGTSKHKWVDGIEVLDIQEGSSSTYREDVYDSLENCYTGAARVIAPGLYRMSFLIRGTTELGDDKCFIQLGIRPEDGWDYLHALKPNKPPCVSLRAFYQPTEADETPLVLGNDSFSQSEFTEKSVVFYLSNTTTKIQPYLNASQSCNSYDIEIKDITLNRIGPQFRSLNPETLELRKNWPECTGPVYLAQNGLSTSPAAPIDLLDNWVFNYDELLASGEDLNLKKLIQDVLIQSPFLGPEYEITANFESWKGGVPEDYDCLYADIWTERSDYWDRSENNSACLIAPATADESVWTCLLGNAVAPLAAFLPKARFIYSLSEIRGQGKDSRNGLSEAMWEKYKRFIDRYRETVSAVVAGTSDSGPSLFLLGDDIDLVMNGAFTENHVGKCGTVLPHPRSRPGLMMTGLGSIENGDIVFIQWPTYGDPVLGIDSTPTSNDTGMAHRIKHSAQLSSLYGVNRLLPSVGMGESAISLWLYYVNKYKDAYGSATDVLGFWGNPSYVYTSEQSFWRHFDFENQIELLTPFSSNTWTKPTILEGDIPYEAGGGCLSYSDYFDSLKSEYQDTIDTMNCGACDGSSGFGQVCWQPCWFDCSGSDDVSTCENYHLSNCAVDYTCEDGSCIAVP